MQGDRAVIDLLNEVLTAELTAVNQYFADAKMCANWGYDRLAEKFREESIGETVPEKFALALELERAAIERLNAGIATCISAGDHGSRELLDHILEGEEGHADWIETQLELVRQVGEAHYLAQQIRN